MNINTQFFDALDFIAKSQNITDVDWAEASHIRRPTLSELRRLSRSGGISAQIFYFSRACTLVKMSKLYSGLSAIIGKDQLKRNFIKAVDNESDQFMRLQMLILMLKNESTSKQDKAGRMLKKLMKL